MSIPRAVCKQTLLFFAAHEWLKVREGEKVTKAHLCSIEMGDKNLSLVAERPWFNGVVNL